MVRLDRRLSPMKVIQMVLAMLWWLLGWQCSKTLETKSCHDANFAITGGTGCFGYDNLWCCQWQQSWWFVMMSTLSSLVAQNVVVMTTCRAKSDDNSSLMAPEAIVMTTSSSTSDDKVGIITTLNFQSTVKSHEIFTVLLCFVLLSSYRQFLA